MQIYTKSFDKKKKYLIFSGAKLILHLYSVLCMKNFGIVLFSLLWLSVCPRAMASMRDSIDISGPWHYRLFSAPPEIPGEGMIMLPGTLDERHKSIYNPPGTNTTQLRREFSFEGTALYSREIQIPHSWKGKEIILTLERTKPTVVMVDGKIVGNDSKISSAQKYRLTDVLSPGRHKLEISVNNRDSIPPLVAHTSNASSESTQTNWNGVLGKMILEARNPIYIENVTIDDREVPEKVKLNVIFNTELPPGYTLITYYDGEKQDDPLSFTVTPQDLWSEFHPVLHDITLKLISPTGEEVDSFSVITGFRNFSAAGNQFEINGNPVFLRGTVNSAVFPATAYAPPDKEWWRDYFSKLKDFGINHVRFHSWTPPEEAFVAADSLGIYLLVELPLWGEADRDLEFQNRFLQEELSGIIEAYAHHPSFVMFSPGNELWGDTSLMGEYMKMAKALNPRILSTCGTNVYLGIRGQIGEEDFLISSHTGNGQDKFVRGSFPFTESPSGGYLNSRYPNNSFDYSASIEGISVPLVAHEVGQYQIYPDFSEIERYTGNLKPDNLEEFRRQAEEAGTLPRQMEYRQASGKWAQKLYQAEMEAALRTPGLAGVEIMSLQDYPGQGGAFVGLFDSFMEQKGFVDRDEWIESFSPFTAIARFPKFSFEAGESVEIPVLAINFTETPDTLSIIRWQTDFAEGELPVAPFSGRLEAGMVQFEIPELGKPQKMKLSLTDSDHRRLNDYDFWIYPRVVNEVKNIVVTDNYEVALANLEKGKSVLFYPDSALISSTSIPVGFVPDFWNSGMYSSMAEEMGVSPSPGTLGLLIEAGHPAFRQFPTENHTDWQWFPIVTNSRALVIDRLPKEINPIVEVIDNIDRNYRVALLQEFKVGKGKLLLATIDFRKATEHPEGRWLLQSLKEYMASKEFNPTVTLSTTQLHNLLTKPSLSRQIRQISSPKKY